jgi:hypothetical protein
VTTTTQEDEARDRAVDLRLLPTFKALDDGER